MLLRGINVGGQKSVRMDRLSGLLESLGLSGVTTYIQSGNAVFASREQSADGVRKMLEEGMRGAFGFPVTAIVRGLGEWRAIVDNNPFSRKEMDEGRLYVTFLARRPAEERVPGLVGIEGGADEARLADREVYLLCRGRYGKTRFSNSFIERQLGVEATTRSWATVNALLAMGRDP